MTLNDLEWLKGHFTLYVLYYERPLTNYLLLIYCRLFITHVTNTYPAEKCGKQAFLCYNSPLTNTVHLCHGVAATYCMCCQQVSCDSKFW